MEKLTWALARDIVPGKITVRIQEVFKTFSNSSPFKKLNFGDYYEGFCQPTQTSPLKLQIDSNVRYCICSI